MSQPRFNTRGFFSLLTTFCFVVMVITGVVLYIEPHGRVAYWTNWQLLGLDKDDWDGIHIVTSFFFLIAAGFHTYFNWKQLVRYLSGRARQGARQWRELAVAGGIVVLACVGASASWYPFAWLLDLSDAAKSAWVKETSEQPPFGHAEMVSVSSLCRKLGLDEEKAIANLEAQGIHARPDQTVEALAKERSLTPQELFRIMKTDNEGTRRGAGLGMGRRGAGAAETEEEEKTVEAALEEEEEHEQHEHEAHEGKGKGLNRPPGGRGLHGGRRGGNVAAEGSPATARVFQQYAGRGLGKRTIAGLCSELGLSVDDGIASLAKQGIEATPGQPIRSVAAAHGMRPAAVLAALCKEGGCQ